MRIKDFIEILQKVENQNDDAFQITAGVYDDCIIIDFSDGRESAVIEKKSASVV